MPVIPPFEPIDPKDLIKEIFYHLQTYAYNGMELCRALNGLDPWDSKGCHFSVQEKPWSSAKGTCKGKTRGCTIPYSTLFRRLKQLEAKTPLRSIKIRWMDNRDPGVAKTSIQMDVFRIWYTSLEYLAVRLVQDIDCYIHPITTW